MLFIVVIGIIIIKIDILYVADDSFQKLFQNVIHLESMDSQRVNVILRSGRHCFPTLTTIMHDHLVREPEHNVFSKI